MKNKFLEKSKSFVQNYDIDENNKDAMNTILNYFAKKDTIQAPISKGLLVRGSIGSGKTMMFKIIQQITGDFAINNVRDIVADFNINGFDGIDSYIKTYNRMIDDIGSEQNGKHYGNDTNVIQELILRRYDQFQSKGLITHFTTNLGSNTEIKERYGERAYDRLREMCTVIILGNNTASRRNKYIPVEKANPKTKERPASEIFNEMRLATIKRFEDYKAGDKDAIQWFTYDWLDKHNFIELSPELKRGIFEQAKKELKIECQREKDFAISPSAVRKITAKYLKETPAIIRAKEISLRNYFDGLIEMDINLNEQI